MKKIILFLFAGFASVFLFAQDRVINDANAEARNVAGFHGIKVSQGIELIIKQGTVEAVAVSASSKEYRDNIKTEVEDGVLKIYFDTKWYKEGNRKWYRDGNNRYRRLKAYVSFKQLDMIAGSSGSSTTIDGSLNGVNVKIALSSGAGFKGTLELISLIVNGSSGAVAHISGKAQNMSVEAHSGSVVHSYELVSDKCEADAESGGVIQVNVNKELAAEATSGGNIHYKGDGVITKVSTGSGGSIKKNG